MAGLEAARLLIRIGSETRSAEEGIDRVDAKLQAAGRSMALQGAALTAGITAPLAGIGAAAIKVAADYEGALNIFQAVTDASAEQMAAAGAQAKALGADLSLPATSAGDAALAMVELAKAGLSVDDTLAAARGALQLSAAGNIGNAEAAKIAAQALNAFHLEGSQAVRVADLLAAAANASAADVQDLAVGLQQGGFAFSATGQHVEDLVGALSILTNVGLTGSDSGTALKNAMVRLISPTDQAKKLMEQLGISVYDAQGNMLPFREIIDVFNRQLGGMTSQQRNAALETIFLSDGMKAFIPILESGVEGWDKMQDAINRGGAAEDLAGARMKGLNGALQGLQSQLETTGLALVEPFLVPMAQGVMTIAQFVGGLADMPRPLVDAGIAFAGVLASVGPILLGMGALTAALGFFLSPLGLVTLGVAALAAAFAADFGGIRTATLPVIDELVGGFQQLVAATNAFQENEGLNVLDAALQALSVRIGETFGPEVQGAFETFTTVVGEAFAGISDAITGALETVLPWVADQFGFVIDWMQTNLPLMAETVDKVLTTIHDVWVQTWPLLQAVIAPVWDAIRRVVSDAIHIILDVITLGMQLITGDWSGAWETFKDILARAWDAVTAIIGDALAVVGTLLGGLFSIIGDIAHQIGDKAFEIGANIVEGVKQGILAKTDEARAAIAGLAGAILDGARQALDSHSPSEEMATIGESVSEGMAVGITRGQARGLAAVNIFMQELVANTANYAAEFGKAGGSLASAFDTAVTQGTEGSVRGLARNLDKFITDLRTAGVSDWRDIGDGLAAAIASGLNDPTEGPVAVIHGIIADATAAMAEMKTPGAILDRLLGDRQDLAAARQTFGNAGADAWLAFNTAVTTGAERDLVKMLDSINKVTDVMRTSGVADWAAMGEEMVAAATNAARAQTEEDRSFWTDELASLIAGGMQNVAANIDAGKKPVRTAMDSFTTAISEGLRDSQLVAQFGVVGAQAVSNLTSFIDRPDNNVATKFGNSIQKLFADAAAAGVLGLGDAQAVVEAGFAQIFAGTDDPAVKTQIEQTVADVFNATASAKVAAAAKKATDANSNAIFDLTKNMTDTLRLKLSPEQGGGLVNLFLESLQGAAAGGANDVTGFQKYFDSVQKTITQGMDPLKALSVTDQFKAAVNDAFRSGDTSGLVEWLKQFNFTMAAGLNQVKQTANFGISQVLSGWNDALKQIQFANGQVNFTQGPWAGHGWATATIGERPPAQVGPFGQVFAGGAPIGMPGGGPTVVQNISYGGSVIVGNDGVQQLTREQERIGMQAAQAHTMTSGAAE